jgi:hypothetical protein
MAKKAARFEKIHHASHELVLSHIQETLKDQCVCYVLITCSPPSKDGKMEVAMSFEGDEDLASFIVDGAAQVFDEKANERERVSTK